MKTKADFENEAMQAASPDFTIQMKCGKHVYLDADDWQKYSTHRWHLINGLVARQEKVDAFYPGGGGKSQIIYLANLICGKGRDQRIRYLDHNKLNLRRENLEKVGNRRRKKEIKLP